MQAAPRHPSTCCARKTFRNSNTRKASEEVYVEICTELTPKFKQRAIRTGLHSHLSFTDVQGKEDLT